MNETLSSLTISAIRQFCEEYDAKLIEVNELTDLLVSDEREQIFIQFELLTKEGNTEIMIAHAIDFLNDQNVFFFKFVGKATRNPLEQLFNELFNQVINLEKGE